jgi:hypothetical protein
MGELYHFPLSAMILSAITLTLFISDGYIKMFGKKTIMHFFFPFMLQSLTFVLAARLFEYSDTGLYITSALGNIAFYFVSLIFKNKLFSITTLVLTYLMFGLLTLASIFDYAKVWLVIISAILLLFDISLLEGNDYDDDDDGTDDDIQEKIIYYNPSISREKVSCFELYKFLYMHFSLSNNIIVLTSRKSIFYSNKNLEIIYKFKILSLILITFSVNFDVYIRLPSRNFVDKEFIYKNIYFILIKLSSFGLNMFICLE